MMPDFKIPNNIFKHFSTKKIDLQVDFKIKTTLKLIKL